MRVTNRTWSSSVKLLLLLAVSGMFTGILAGCSSSRLAVRLVSPAIDPMMESIFAEEDLQIARSAMEADIKLLGGLLRMSPAHRENHLRMSQLLAGYCLLFAAPDDKSRAIRLYQRSADAAGLSLNDSKLSELLLNGTRAEFRQGMRNLQAQDREALFWWSFATGGRLSLQLDDPATIVQLPRIEAVMSWCVEGDPEYFFGSGLLFLGAVMATRPQMLGGDTELASQYFDRVASINGGQLWLVDLYRARYVCTASWDEEQFVELLENVIHQEQLPPREDLRLLNSFARRQAADLLERRYEFF
jgi:hypothetical protein